MFRIESYITPIILSHIDKYVKDFRPQDAQMSLWGGEVAFQNLDVRLDVLEEELQLPFNFVSGHIHELTVRVPWTKIASEPIQITINTIEFVLKLKTADAIPKRERKRKPKTEIVQDPPGYMASLVNRIANNISLKLHNIILKYVEEDIVVSMNIQLLSFDSADENWNPAFIDINPTKVLLKKVINISDLTICLDKRNSLGKIDICQEPILYRCTLQVRLLRRYNISSAHQSSLLRIDIFTESIELNISAQQYPMLLRLIVLAMTLKEGKIRSNSNLSTSCSSTTAIGATEATSTTDDPDEDDDADVSMLSWAWSLIPSIFPIDPIEDDGDQKGHYLHTGVYVNSMKITFKSQELTADSIVHSTKKIKYHPILRISLNGIYMDSLTLGTRWFNLKGGISYIGIYPLGTCPCGHAHTQTSILTAADIPFDHSKYLDDSLKDPSCPENTGQQRLYDDKTWQLHSTKITQEYLLQRTPAIALDLVHHVDIPDDVAHSSLGSDLEFSNLSESYLLRGFVGPITVKYSTSVVHIWETLKEYADSYDYAPYVLDKLPLTLAQLSPPSTEDFEALMTDIPLRVYQLNCMQPIIEVYVEDHESNNKKKSRPLPYISIECDRLNVTQIDPYYPNRLVHTTCQLPQPPHKLLDHCYAKVSNNMKNLNVFCNFGSTKQRVLSVTNAEGTLKRLIKPDFWNLVTLPKTHIDLNVEQILLEINKPQIVLINYLLDALRQEQLNQQIYDSSLLCDIMSKNQPTFELHLTKLLGTVAIIGSTIGVNGQLGSIYGFAYVPKTLETSLQMSHKLKSMIICSNGLSPILQFLIQLPLDLKTITTIPPIVLLTSDPIDINLDPIFCEFLKYEVQFVKRQDLFDSLPRTPRKSIVETKSTSRKSINNPPESVHSSSEPTVTLTLLNRPKLPKPASKPLDILNIHNIARCLILQADIKQWTIYSPDKSLKLLQPNSTLKSIVAHSPDISYAVFKLPTITIKSSHTRNTSAIDFKEKFPITCADWNQEKDGFPWNFSLVDLHCFTYQHHEIFAFIQPVKTKITLAITLKPKDEQLQKNVYDHSFAIHVDTAPLEFNLYEKQVAFLHTSIGKIQSLFSTSYGLPPAQSAEQHLEISERPHSPNYHSELKEFFGTVNTVSENSSEETVQEDDQTSSKMSIWIQWTLAKLTSKFLSQNKCEKRKFILEFEDIITSIDKQDVYMKIKTKVGSLSGICKTADLKLSAPLTPDEQLNWQKNDLLGLIARSDTLMDNLDTFFELTITKAVTKNVHNKWGTKKKKNFNLNDTITEIMVNVQTIDVNLDLKMLEGFLPIFNVFSSPTDANVKKSVLSVSDLPLVFVQSKGIRIFIPILSNTAQCNVFIFRINSISITPTVENPLNRIPVRGDIYTKAAQLRILNVPGSKIEDRQYEVMFSNISIGSGKWEEILTYMDPYTEADSYNENPAFDWNNQTERPSIDVNTIFKNFNLSITYAPCIVFKNVLVCGQGIEINCLTDLMLDLTTHEVLLFNNLSLEILKLLESTKSTALTNELSEHSIKSSSSSAKSIKITTKTSYKTILAMNEAKNTAQKSENQIADSGFESYDYFSMRRQKHKDTNTSKSMSSSTAIKPLGGVTLAETKTIPFDISFVGGDFSLRLYHLMKDPDCSTKRLPLFHLTLYQPNMLISQSVNDKTIQLSLFNMLIRLGSDQEIDEKNEFPTCLFETRQGHLDLFGIPPSLLKYKQYLTIIGEKHLQFHVKRSMAINFSPTTLDKVLKIKTILDKFTIQHQNLYPPTATVPSPITTSNKIKIIKQLLFNANRFDFSVGHAEIDFSQLDEFKLSVAFANVSTKIELFEYPQRLTFNSNLTSFVVSTGHITCLNPLTIQTTGALTQENWKRNPLIILNVVSNCIDINCGPESYVNVTKARFAFEQALERYSDQTKLMDLEDFIDEPEDVERLIGIESLQHIPMPKLSRTSLQTIEEYYQDDLRAGAFQFIDSFKDDYLPLPYQIQIIARDGGIICWRYPQPRALHYVQIFPVPFQSSSDQKIKCNLEYYSECHRSFLPYCTFSLSDRIIQELQLPERKVTAEIWRILVIQPFVSVDGNYFQGSSSSSTDDDDEDDDVNKKVRLEKTLKRMSAKVNATGIEEYLKDAYTTNLLNLHPRSLVGCMRIDSFFSPRLIPSLQIVLNISHFTVSVQNSVQPAERQMPDILRQYKLAGALNDVQCAGKLYLRNIKSHLCFYQDYSSSLHTEFLMSSSILDYSYLTMQPLIDEFIVKLYIENVSNGCASVNVVLDELRVRYGPSVGHTIAITEQIWRQTLTDELADHIILTRFVVCNQTTVPIQFGQWNSEERIFLQSKECFLYAFRSEKLEQKLQFSIEETNWQQSAGVPISIVDHQQQYVRVGENQIFLLKTEKLSATQKRIVVKGQIEFLNQTNESFRVHYKVGEMSKEASRLVEFELVGKSSISVAGQCNNKITQCIQLRLTNAYGKGWSGEIPLQNTLKHSPWLVKVPTTSPQQFISFWVRVQREDIELNENNRNVFADVSSYPPQRLLITIWPMFMLRSLLPNDIEAVESSTQTYALKGQGKLLEIQVPGTHDTEHDISLLLNFKNQSKALLSYKAIDRNKFFVVPDKLTKIDDSICELDKSIDLNWPCSREEELRLNRFITISDQIQPNFKCSASRELSCSLMLDVLPWCLFINSIGCDIKLINSTDSNTLIIPSNNIAVPFIVAKSFSFLLNHQSKWHSSQSQIYINGNTSQRQKTQPFYDLPDEGTIIVKMFVDSMGGLCKFSLTSLNENGVRVIMLLPHFVLCNFSKYKLNCWAFSILQKEKQNFKNVIEHATAGKCLHKLPVQSAQSPHGIGITIFTNLSEKSKDSAISKLFNYFIVICLDDSDEYSYPILLNKTSSRLCFSLPNSRLNYIPLAISIIENNGQQFVCINDDQSPILEFHNCTEMDLLIAQSDSVDATRSSIPIRTPLDEHFDLYAQVPANTKLFYTPPLLDEHYPDKFDGEVGLIVALVNDPTPNNGKTIGRSWSQPIKIYESSELFLNLPLYGDVKIIVQTKEKVIKFIIENINYKMEFNVKDIRTKLLNPSTSSDCIVPVQNRDNEWCEDYRRPSYNEDWSDLLRESSTTFTKDSTDYNLSTDTFTVPTKVINLNIFVRGLNCTLYSDDEHHNNSKIELIAIYFDDLVYFFDGKQRTMDLAFTNFQIDNQLFATTKKFDFPVVICAENLQKIRNDVSTRHETSQLPSPFEIQDFIKQNVIPKAIGTFRVHLYDSEFSPEEILCNLQPIRAYIEDKYVYILLDFLIENHPMNLVYRQDVDVRRERCVAGSVLIPKIVVLQAQSLAEPFKLRHVRIEPLSVLLSVHTCMRMYIALDHSPLDFAPFERNDIYSLPMRFGYNLGMHYVSGAIFGAGWVVGSLEILGSPSGLARSVSTGLRDFLSMPVQGLLRGPWGFFVGITHGSASLLRNITAGTVNSVTKLAASVARNLDRLSLDDEHLQRTEALRRSRPQGITHGFAQGLTGLGISILGAVGGLARHPLEARSSVGVVTGLGRGLVGAVTKPISGAAELVALTGQGMLHTVGFNTMPMAREQLFPHYQHRIHLPVEPVSSAKIVWKFLPQLFANDQILFLTLATLDTRTGLQSISIALTNKLIVIVSMERDELIEIIALERAFPVIDELDDETLVNINVASKTDDENGDLQGFQYGRVLQYVRDSSEQLPMMSSLQQHSKFTESIEDTFGAVAAKNLLQNHRKTDHKISIFMDKHLAKHFVRYIELLKCKNEK